MPDLETEPAPQVLPQEWMEELNGMHPKSFEYQQTLGVLQSLATEAGLRDPVVDLRDQTIDLRDNHESTLAPTAPAGYESVRFVEKGAQLDLKQFEGIIFSFASSEAEKKADVLELKTDTGKAVRICDLRPLMTSQVRENGPKNEAIARLLDKDVLMDVKRQVEQGHGGKKIEDVEKVRYSSRKGTKVRAYWMVVNDANSQGAMTIARLADCDDSFASEAATYRRVFHKTM